jgi:predicted transcriptional regulator
MSGHKILIELEPEVEQRLREIAAINRESISAVASGALNALIWEWIIRERRAGKGPDQEGKELRE